MITSELILNLLEILAAAWILGFLFSRFGMNGRGAVELVVATVVMNLSDDLINSKVIGDPLLTNDQFSALVLMAFITTLIAPISLKWGVTRTCLPVEKAAFCRLWDEKRGP